MIKLLEGQKIYDEDGNLYEIEKRDILKEEELHYSDVHKLQFIDSGWEQVDEDSFTKTFRSGKVKGELNPSGKAIIYLNFDSTGRWIDVSIGFAGADWDGRNYIGNSNKLVDDVEKEIMLYLKDRKSRFSVKGQ